MMKVQGQRGLSLVEVTIMLLVLMLLTGVLAPSIFDFVNDARWVKVKEDCEAIGITVSRLHRDVGCIRLDGTVRCTKSNRVDILFSDGPDVTAGDLIGVGANNYFSGAGNMKTAGYRWSDESDSNYGDNMEDQFVTNAPLYAPASSYAAIMNNGFPAGPLFNVGWRGAYLSSPIGPDPWGHRYLVNSVFLTTAVDANSAGEGGYIQGWDRDTFCLSAGPNGLYETFFGGSATGYGTQRLGDDFVYIISGGTR